MCGIVGVVSCEPLDEKERSRIELMNNRILHRGPDGVGEFNDTHVSLAMCRLSIIDLAEGWQPLYNEDKSVVLIANGEIYNFVELRRDLISKGHTFRTSSDCEVIVHLYEELGIECVHSLRGMFAFALFDCARNELFLARDRMGEKPLYLYEHNSRLYFASELKAFLASELVPFKLNSEAVDQYFHFQYVPEPQTPIEGVRKLPPASTLTVNISSWALQERQFWNIEDAPPLDGDPVEVLMDELDVLRKLILRADVPVGVALSGGLDSSIVAALASKENPGSIHAFTVGYSRKPKCDERQDARKLADHLRMPHHDVEINTNDIVEFFPRLNYYRDDPIADIAGHSYYAVHRLASESGVPVVLQGHGGDELFWGYSWLKEALYWSEKKQMLFSSPLKGILSHLKPHFPNHISARSLLRWGFHAAGSVEGLYRILDAFRYPERMIFEDASPSFRPALIGIDLLYHPDFRSHVKANTAYEPFSFPHPWPDVGLRLTNLICSTYLLENGLSQSDRLSMASSVELRVPFVDHIFVEKAIGIRKFRHDQHLEPKHFLKKLAAKFIPEYIIGRRKRGFTPPVRDWYTALFDKYGSDLCDGYLVNNNIISSSAGSDISRGFLATSQIRGLAFRTLVLESWCRQFA